MEAFRLPSNNQKIYFRRYTVNDALSIAGRNPNFEESIATQFLNDMQVVEREQSDATNWTISDRKLALMWLYVMCRDDPNVPTLYRCPACKKSHRADVDVVKLMQTASMMDGESYREFEIVLNGATERVRITPLYGNHAEDLENRRLMRDKHAQDSDAYHRHQVDIMYVEHAHCITFLDHQMTLDDKLDYIKQLDLERDFRMLASKTEFALREMQHGIPAKYRDGRYYYSYRINVPCAKEGKSARELLLPFRCHDYLPRLYETIT